MAEKKIVLSVENLVKKFDQKKYFYFFTQNKKSRNIINNISFDLKEGEITALLGSNGAGKTTIIHMLLSILEPTSGDIKYFGKSLFKYRSEILEKVSFASPYIKLPSKLTVEENLDIYARLYKLSNKTKTEKIKDYLNMFNLYQEKNTQTSLLSTGQLTMLTIIKAFMTNPKVVLLDEPTASLDLETAYIIRDFIIKQQKEHNLTILFASHNMEEISEICNRALVLKNGELIANSSLKELIQKNKAKLILTTQDIEKIQKFTLEKNIPILINTENMQVILEISENLIASVLKELTQNNISYLQVKIDRPTLNNYFLSNYFLIKTKNNLNYKKLINN